MAAQDVLDLKKQIEKLEDGDESRAMDLLEALGKVNMTMDLLQKTLIGITISNLKKSFKSSDISSTVKALKKKWKAVATADAAVEVPKKEKKVEEKVEKTETVEEKVADMKTSSTSSLLEEDGEEQDDEEGDDEDNGEGGTVVAFMSGIIKIDGGELKWSGKWAESEEALGSGSSRFKYKAVCDEGDLVGQEVEFSGRFVLGDTEVKEKDLTLNFKASEGKKCRVTGEVSNKNGRYRMVGEYDSKSGKMALSKLSLDDEESEDEDIDCEVEEDELGANSDDDLSPEQLRAKYGG